MDEKKYSEKEIFECMELYGEIHHKHKELCSSFEWLKQSPQIEKSLNFYRLHYDMCGERSERIIKLIRQYNKKVPEKIRIDLDFSNKFDLNVNDLEEKCKKTVGYTTIEEIFYYFKTKFSKISL